MVTGIWDFFVHWCAFWSLEPPMHQVPHFNNRVMALDAATGETLWQYDEPVLSLSSWPSDNHWNRISCWTMIARGTQCKRLIVFLLAERPWLVFLVCPLYRCKRFRLKSWKTKQHTVFAFHIVAFCSPRFGITLVLLETRRELFLSPGQSAALMVWFASPMRRVFQCLAKALKQPQPAYLFSCVRPHTTDLGECHGNRYYRFSCASVSFEPVLTTCYSS